MSSSDLDLAREISRRLTGAPFSRARASAPEPTPRVGVAAPDPSGFVSLRRNDPVPAPVPTPTPTPRVFGAGGWENLLEWTLAATGSEAAFLMDPHGLVVACRGPLPAGQAERLGARLMVALDQARRMAPTEEEDISVTVQFGEVFLTGFAAPLSDGILLTAGLVSRKPVEPSARGAVARALAAS